MMNVLALGLLIFSSSMASGFSPPPDAKLQHDQPLRDHLVREGHRLIVVDYERQATHEPPLTDSSTAHHLHEPSETVVHKVKEVGGAAIDKAQRAGESAVDMAKDAGHAVVGKAEGAAQTVVDKAEDVGEEVIDKAKQEQSARPSVRSRWPWIRPRRQVRQLKSSARTYRT